MQISPFYYGSPVSIDNFIVRHEEIKTICDRLVKGQSTAITGDPHIGKTSLLNYLVSKKVRNTLYRGEGERWIFSRIDGHMLGTEFTPAQFWKYALTPIKKKVEEERQDSSLASQYLLCSKNNFDNNSLKELFTLLKETGEQFILIIDEFDSILHYPMLNGAEFYGGLRHLTSLHEYALVTIIASRADLSQLLLEAKSSLLIGSPFLNTFIEIALGPFDDKNVND